MKDPTKFTADRQAIVLKTIAETGKTAQAAEDAGVCVRTVNLYRQRDPEGFGKAFTEARRDATALLERIAWDLATVGSLTEYFDKEGNLTHSKHRIDTRLLWKLLQANDPERYMPSVRVNTTHTEIREARIRIDVGSMSREEQAAARLLCRGAMERGEAEGVSVVIHEDGT